ncbi:glycopeptide antibiotics resistance protein [Arthrobacter stackebrandtii]|uniref:Glycopeptide antibiotics resistance protein n=1 Tax=Arthrobacter stackebrandtii TaxID=272161 RepID=A0ABS4YTB7_9MICC|nr:glycopeptide antibiotics resistance protein [Arthrobacter stackebrandtii]
MGEWVWPAYVGILGGIGLFAVLTVPIVVIQYRRYGRFTWRRFLGAAAAGIYATALVAYTLLPLPDPAAMFCSPGGSTAQLVPFNFLADIRRETTGMGTVAAASSRVVLQVAFNVVLFIPWGIFVRRYLDRGIMAATLTGLLASVAIETTQFTGLWGIYDCAYRVADIDDVMTNTLGALLGAIVAPAVLWFMPRQRELQAARSVARPVTVARRWVGMIVDFALLGFIGSVLAIAARLIARLFWNADTLPSWVEATLSYGVPALVVFYLPALFGAGGSLGQRAVWLAPSWARPSLLLRLWRASVVGGLYLALQVLAQGTGAKMTGLATMLGGLLLAANFLMVLFGKERRGLSGVLSGARMVDSRSSRAGTSREGITTGKA